MQPFIIDAFVVNAIVVIAVVAFIKHAVHEACHVMDVTIQDN